MKAYWLVKIEAAHAYQAIEMQGRLLQYFPHLDRVQLHAFTTDGVVLLASYQTIVNLQAIFGDQFTAGLIPFVEL